MKHKLNVEQVAKEFGVNPATLWRWRKAGKFPEPTRSENDERELLWDWDQIEPLLARKSRTRYKMRADQAAMSFAVKADSKLFDYEDKKAYTTGDIASMILSDFHYLRQELARRAGLPKAATFEDIASEIDSLKSQIDAIKGTLSKNG
ncbi:MAG: hypothetical protein OEV87_12265 [Phycisphaerae bacterium]|nr:hypothetical protein [Phycisphaerae bacterium]